MNHQRPYKRPQKLHINVDQGEVVCRLLCPIAFAGAVIGASGSVIKRLEQETSTKILVEDALAPDAEERLVYVVGGEAAAQEAVVRVYERIMEVEKWEGDKERCCRLLAVREQIGAVMGREGRRIEGIRRESGAFVRVFKSESGLPVCADVGDELIQITGGSIAVRKALVLVSKFLHENQPKGKASAVETAPCVSSSYGAFQNPQMPSYPNNGSSFTPFRGNVVKPPPEYSSFKENKLYPNINGLTAVEVVFKMLCSSDVVGSVIGKGGVIVKALQEQTGASIRFDTQVVGCLERAITISALEKVESYQAPAQNAVIRVFARATEALTKSGLVSQRNNGEGVTARFLIQSHQAGCLIGVRGTIVSELQRATGTRIQLLEGNQVPICASNDERVVQIAGEYANVKDALVEVTRRLRERLFASKGLNIEKARNYAPRQAPDFVPPGRVDEGITSNYNQTSNFASYKNGMHTLEQKMEDLNLSEGVDDHLLPKFLPHQHFAGRRGVATSTSNAEAVSEDSSATVTNITVEVVVPEDIFSSVLEDGNNLARLKEISGAKVEVQRPSAGNVGKVIISGTPSQTLAGQSLLRAYIVTAK